MGRMPAVRTLCLLAVCALIAAAQTQAADVVTIEQAVSEALDRNLTLLAQRYDVSIAEAGLITARLRPNPVLEIGGDHLDIAGTGYDQINNAGPAEYNIRTDFVFERGGKRQRRIDVANAEIDRARLEVMNAARQIVLEVQSAFVDLQLAKENLALANENLEAFTNIVNVNAIRVTAGDLAEVDLVRSRVAALQFRNQVRQAEMRVRVARNRLQLLLGRARVTDRFDVAGEMRRTPGPSTAADIQSDALRLRPDLLALRRREVRNQAELRLQLAQGRVDYTVGTEFRRQQGIAGTGNSIGIFFQTNLPVFNRNQGEIERVRREQRQIEARLREMEAGIRVEVENAFEQFATARTLLEDIERDMLAQARDVRQITGYSYRRGEANLIELLDAQRAFNETMQAYNEARAEYARSLYVLESAAGVNGARP